MSARIASCPQCGKEFCVMSPSDWVYRVGSTYYCSWRCIREYDAHIPPHPETNAPKPGPMSPEELEKFEAEDKRVRTKLRRQCTVKPSEEKREKRVVRPRSTAEEKKKTVTECWRLMNEEGLTMPAASERLGMSLSTMGNWFAKYRDELGIPRVPAKEAGGRSWNKRPDRHRSCLPSRQPNLSGEKIGRILAALTRIRDTLDEISKEVTANG